MGKAAHRELRRGAVDVPEIRGSFPAEYVQGSVTPLGSWTNMVDGRAVHSKGMLEAGAVERSAEMSVSVVLTTSRVTGVDAVGGVAEAKFEKKVGISCSAYLRVLRALRAGFRIEISHIFLFAAFLRTIADFAAWLSFVRRQSLSAFPEPTAVCILTPKWKYALPSLV